MTDARSPERIRAHYLIEVELADRLRDAPPEARRQMYGEVYDELFRRVHDHPQLTRRTNPAQQSSHGCEQARLIAQFLPRGGHYVEVGAGDCATARHVAAFAGQVTAVEVSGDIVPQDLPANVQVALSDGVSIPVADASADVVYSNQLMEHLHPNDAAEQLANIARALRPGGRYLCITPNRISGPHDISAAFDSEARGFHLREYTYSELGSLFRGAGFRSVGVFEQGSGRSLESLSARLGPALGERILRTGRRAVVLPLTPFVAIEALAVRRPGKVEDNWLLRRALGIRLIGRR